MEKKGKEKEKYKRGKEKGQNYITVLTHRQLGEGNLNILLSFYV